MIRNHDEFESAMHELANMLANPPAPFTAEDIEFGKLLDAFDAYMPAIAERPPGDALAERAHALTVRAEAFRREREQYERTHNWSTDTHGHGIGPTTGGT